MNIKKYILDFLHNRINEQNRNKLTNTSPTLICSNCVGGFLYHWLHLQFRSPFINLWLTPEDFVTALENFDEFINTPLLELKNSGMDYPVAIGAFNIKVYFMHYKSYEEAIEKWNERKKRINKDNLGVILSNYLGGDKQLLKRFNDLPFKNKVVFTNNKWDEKTTKAAIYLKNYDPCKGNIYRTISITGKRCIDQFDYVKFINKLKE